MRQKLQPRVPEAATPCARGQPHASEAATLRIQVGKHKDAGALWAPVGKDRATWDTPCVINAPCLAGLYRLGSVPHHEGDCLACPLHTGWLISVAFPSLTTAPHVAHVASLRGLGAPTHPRAQPQLPRPQEAPCSSPQGALEMGGLPTCKPIGTRTRIARANGTRLASTAPSAHPAPFETAAADLRPGRARPARQVSCRPRPRRTRAPTARRVRLATTWRDTRLACAHSVLTFRWRLFFMHSAGLGGLLFSRSLR